MTYFVSSGMLNVHSINQSGWLPREELLQPACWLCNAWTHRSQEEQWWWCVYVAGRQQSVTVEQATVAASSAAANDRRSRAVDESWQRRTRTRRKWTCSATSPWVDSTQPLCCVVLQWSWCRELLMCRYKFDWQCLFHYHLVILNMFLTPVCLYYPQTV